MLDVNLFLRNSYLVSLQVMMCQPSISLSQMVRLRNQPSLPWLKEEILIIAGVVAAVLALAGYGFGSYYYSRGQVAERYEAAAKKSFKDSLEYQVWSDTKKEIKTSEVKYTDTKSTQAYSKSQLMSGERMQKVGRQFLIFLSGESW